VKARRLADLIRDVAIEMHARRARSVLMVLAVALSTGTLLSAVGVSTVAAQQIDADLAASAIDLVTVTPAPQADAGTGDQLVSVELLPPDAEARARALDLVAAAGTRLDPGASTSIVVSRNRPQPGAPSADVTVAGLTPGYLDVVRAGVPESRAALLRHDEPVALLGTAAAATLDIPVTANPTGFRVWINGRPHSIVGFLDGGDVDLSRVVAIPYESAVEMAGGDLQSRMLIRTDPGAGAPVASVIRTAVLPGSPEALRSSQVADLSSLRQGVSTQLTRLAAWTGALLLVLAVLLIANSMVVSVMARTSEIGLRRALGASRRAVAGVFLVEGALTGLLGGLTGSALSATAVVAVSAAYQWTATLSPSWVALGPIVGALVGVVSSAYPALRAANVEPGIAVRSD
jgi:putative ABC transport system permease protein